MTSCLISEDPASSASDLSLALSFGYGLLCRLTIRARKALVIEALKKMVIIQPNEIVAVCVQTAFASGLLACDQPSQLFLLAQDYLEKIKKAKHLYFNLTYK